MNPLQMQAISRIGPNRYEVTLVDSAGAVEITICEVFTHNGITAARFTPDLSMSSHPPRIDSRALVAAVLTCHRRLTGEIGSEK